MSLFDRLGNQQIPQQMNPQEMLQKLQTNPVATLRQAGLKIPEGINNPQQIINYLLQSGQINNPRLQMAQQLAGRLFPRR